MSTLIALISQAHLAQVPSALVAFAQAPPTLPMQPETIGMGEMVAFWVLGPLALGGGLGMVFARNAVHSALWLALSMLSLGVLYVVQQAEFLGFVQVIVYTGAIMMLFLFVLMLVGRDSVDSMVEVLRGQRVAAALAGIGLALLLVASVGRALQDVGSVGLAPVNAAGGNVANLGRILFTDYVFPFELTSALLITAALGAMVLTYTERGREGRMTQRERVEARVRGTHPSPLPGPGVFATTSSVATPALLPDGSVAPASLSEIIEATARERLDEDLRSVANAGTGVDSRALRGRVSGAGTDRVGTHRADTNRGTDSDRADSDRAESNRTGVDPEVGR